MLMKLFRSVIGVSLTMGLICCYKRVVFYIYICIDLEKVYQKSGPRLNIINSLRHFARSFHEFYFQLSLSLLTYNCSKAVLSE